MTALALPAPNAPAEEWGRLAVSIPGWRWMPGMLDTEGNRWGRVTLQYLQEWRYSLPDPDDPANAGCFLALLGGQFTIRKRHRYALDWRGMAPLSPGTGDVMRTFGCCGDTLGRAAITAAVTFGKWPGGGA